MNISFLDNWRKRHRMSRGMAVYRPGPGDPEGLARLLSDFELLRAQAAGDGVELDGSAASLEALDQLLPLWRDDSETLSRLGNDAGLYLGTVVIRTVRGARWQLWPNGRPVVVLPSGRALDVVTAGQEWAAGGTPGLIQSYAEAAEG
ncbi:DUF6278 family protein [Streptomyces sp. TRM 70351]|uniref:DUF6278 family protein n=1 Tax=Streptomyces sp. TRM 70351 TaxID=3116552 RepID=UPI002E7B638C|nr:DUF6278 family protein [Streptomyces sp. TRM 70351]MEE1926905.1 DUF6278 family protein [Streptomyces sp. TRM 70351]